MSEKTNTYQLNGGTTVWRNQTLHLDKNELEDITQVTVFVDTEEELEEISRALEKSSRLASPVRRDGTISWGDGRTSEYSTVSILATFTVWYRHGRKGEE